MRIINRFVLMALMVSAISLSACKQASSIGAPPSPVVVTPPVVTMVDTSTLATDERQYLIDTNVGIYGVATIFAPGVPIKVYAGYGSDQNHGRVAKFWLDTSQGGWNLQFVGSAADATPGMVFLNTAANILSESCGSGKPSVIANNIITSGAGSIGLGVKDGCMNMDWWIEALLAHEIGHALGLWKHTYETTSGIGQDVMSSPTSIDLVATPLLVHVSSLLSRQTPGARVAGVGPMSVAVTQAKRKELDKECLPPTH